MAEAKTKPTKVSVRSYLNAIEDPARRADCETISALMERVTGCPPVMWGTSIVGFDQYHYKYESGHEGDSCVVGFSSRKGDISVYIMAGYEETATKALLAKLGKHKIGKACLYIKTHVRCGRVGAREAGGEVGGNHTEALSGAEIAPAAL